MTAAFTLAAAAAPLRALRRPLRRPPRSLAVRAAVARVRRRRRPAMVNEPDTTSPPGSVGGLSTAATAGTADFGTTVDELDASVADVLERISALAVGTPAGSAAVGDAKVDEQERGAAAAAGVGAASGEETAVGVEKVGEGAAAQKVRLVYCDEFLKHRNPRGAHPECPERLEVIVAAIKNDERLSDVVEWVEPTPVAVGSARRELVLDLVREVHTYEDYLEEVQAISKRGGGLIDADTYVAAGSWEVALLAVSAWLDAVDYALSDGGGPAFALARPPGHHANRVTGMGFCLLSNAAIAAQYALRRERVARVGIVDFDVHHGNGTEHCVKQDGRIRFASSHESPLYPYTGPASFTGPLGTVLNVELPAGTGMDTYRDTFTQRMLPHVLKCDDDEALSEGLVIVSAGFDALDVDPLANLDFKPEDYEELCATIIKAVNSSPGYHHVICGLEGGYNLEGNGISAAAVHTVLGLARL